MKIINICVTLLFLLFYRCYKDLLRNLLLLSSTITGCSSKPIHRWHSSSKSFVFLKQLDYKFSIFFSFRKSSVRCYKKMSKRKSLARLAVERSQSSQDIPEENVHRSSSNARPLSHHAAVEVPAGDGDRVQHQPLPPRDTRDGAPPPPAVTRRRPGRSSAEHADNTSHPKSAAIHNNRHSYPAAASTLSHGQTSQHSWQSPAIPAHLPPGSPPQKPPRVSLQQPFRGNAPQRSAEDSGRPGAAAGRVLLQNGSPSGAGTAASSAASPPSLSFSPPADPAAVNGLPRASPSASSGSSADSSGSSALLTARAMHHAHSTNDLQGRAAGRPADGSPGPHWNKPITAEHRAR